jgi:hypothetical protein
MHGCDAHWAEKVAAPAEERYCWVKGDLSFETLRQVVLEPEDRVRIGPAPPGTILAEQSFAVPSRECSFVDEGTGQIDPE